MDIKDNEYYLIKISEFLDGELSADETRELFNYIADNPELQEELKTSMAVRNMFHQELIEPPKQSKIFLYSKLNLQKTAVILTFFISFLSQFRKVLLNPTVGATLIGISIFLLGYFTAEYAKKQNIISTSKQTSNNITSHKTNETIPIVSSVEINNQQPVTTNSQPLSNNNKTKLFTSIVANSTKFDQKPQNSLNTQPTEIYEENIPLEKNNQYVERLVISTAISKNHLNIQLNISKDTHPEIDYLISSFLDKMSIAITKSNNNSNIKTNLEPLSNPMLNDYTVAIGYNLNENNALAIEFGQENYAQRYSGIINQSNAIINQVYTAQWYGLSYQYNFDKISEQVLINPFFKILSGFTKIGPIFKGSLGLSFSVNDKLIINAGLEGSTLIYEFQGNRFNTNKYGFFYGAKLNF